MTDNNEHLLQGTEPAAFAETPADYPEGDGTASVETAVQQVIPPPLIERVQPDANGRAMLYRYHPITREQVGDPVPYVPPAPQIPKTLDLHLTHDHVNGYRWAGGSPDPQMAHAVSTHVANLVSIHAYRAGIPIVGAGEPAAIEQGYEDQGWQQSGEGYDAADDGGYDAGQDEYDDDEPRYTREFLGAAWRKSNKSSKRRAAAAAVPATDYGYQGTEAAEPREPSMVGEWMSGRLGAIVKVGATAIIVASTGAWAGENVAANIHDAGKSWLHFHAPTFEWQFTNWRPWGIFNDL